MLKNRRTYEIMDAQSIGEIYTYILLHTCIHTSILRNNKYVYIDKIYNVVAVMHVLCIYSLAYKTQILCAYVCMYVFVLIFSGLNDNSIVLGKHSGRHAFRSRLEELGTDSKGYMFIPYVCMYECMYVCMYVLAGTISQLIV